MIKCNVCHQFKECESPVKGQVESINCLTSPYFFKDGRCSINGGLCYAHGKCTAEGCKVYKDIYEMISTISVQTFAESLDTKFNHAVEMADDMKMPLKIYIIDTLLMHEWEIDADIDKIKAKLIELGSGIFFDHTETSMKGGNIPRVEDDRYICLDIIL